ncbi:MAG: DUF2782 domain-containing protein [Pseudomonadota bacterium]
MIAHCFPTARRLLYAARALVVLSAAGCGGWAQAQAGAATGATPPPPDLSQMAPEPTGATRTTVKPGAATANANAKAGDAANKPDTPPGARPATLPWQPGEPVVQRTVIEDEGSRIEETRVRGQLQRVTVTPKVGNNRTSYEILPGDGSGSEASRTTAGKRVWNVLQF